jgi:hypothetical protein
MTRRDAAVWLALALWTAGAGGGCSGAPSATGSMEEATVKGTVRVRGKPVTNGRVSFRSSNINRPTAPTKDAEIGKDGTYSVTTLVGANFVDVSCKEILTPKNRDLVENEQMVTIKSGENILDINLPSQGPLTVR